MPGAALERRAKLVPLQSPGAPGAATSARRCSEAVVPAVICPQLRSRNPMLYWVSDSGSGGKCPQYRSKYVRDHRFPALGPVTGRLVRTVAIF
jgi:hypothetical protein